jgi:hypothetical protein
MGRVEIRREKKPGMVLYTSNCSAQMDEEGRA